MAGVNGDSKRAVGVDGADHGVDISSHVDVACESRTDRNKVELET